MTNVNKLIEELRELPSADYFSSGTVYLSDVEDLIHRHLESMPNLEFWAIIEDGELHDEMYGIGVINGVYGASLDQIHDELKDHILEIKDEHPRNCTIEFIAKNIFYQEGQMSHPETGQWDFPPHYSMDITIKKINDHDKSMISAKGESNE